MKVVILGRGVGGLVASNLLVKKPPKTHEVVLGFSPFPKECTEDEKIEASSPNS